MCGARDPKEIGMHSLRGGTVAGVHEVSFFGQDEEVTLTHRATSRQIFVNGAWQPRRSSSPANPASIRSTRSCLSNQVSTESAQRRDSK